MANSKRFFAILYNIHKRGPVMEEKERQRVLNLLAEELKHTSKDEQ